MNAGRLLTCARVGILLISCALRGSGACDGEASSPAGPTDLIFDTPDLKRATKRARLFQYCDLDRAAAACGHVPNHDGL